jgi:hypothetical protein
VTQYDLFTEPVTDPAEADNTTAPIVPFDLSAWSLAQNPTPTRCDKCSNWTRTLTNVWGECSARKTWENEYAGLGCVTFSPATSSCVTRPLDSDTAEAIYRARGYDAFGRPYP